MLGNINSQNIRSLGIDKLNVLCDEIRAKIRDTVLVTGGHLASNLGIVETTVAMHYVFSFPRDKVVFDVGHQCYAHKLLTGRLSRFNTLRTEGGISGFPKRAESEYDSFDTGHAGTAISAALGIAKARDLKKENYDVIAIVGDGSFNNGLIYEALNSLRILKTNILIVLNDNGMSISPTVGGMHDILNEIKSGEPISSIPDVSLFERFGVEYIGIKNGNDVEEMVSAFSEAKEKVKDHPVLLHVVTKKGRGYEFCEENPVFTHGVSPRGSAVEREYSTAFGSTLTSLAKRDKRIVAVTAAMTDSLGLRGFFNAYPERSFDVGICEEHASILCAGMATQGLKPYYAIYSSFLQRAYDEIIHDICCQNLPVTFCVDRAGISGSDGETHQGVFDLSYLIPIPNLTIAVPKDIDEFISMIEFSSQFNSPLAIRYPRSGANSFGEHRKITSTAWEYLEKSPRSSSVVLSCGERCIALAYAIRDDLKKENIEIDIVNARFVKPLDEKILSAIKDKHIVTLEDNMLLGGFGSTINEFFAGENASIKSFAYRDSFICQGKVDTLMDEFGLTRADITEYLKKQNAGG